MNSSHEELSSANLFDVKDLIVVVTGGGTGIGQMITRALVANGVKKVYIVGRRLEVLETTAEVYGQNYERVVPIQADLALKSGVEQLKKKLESEEKYIDILINNAAIGGPNFDPSLEKLEEIADSLWQTKEEEAQELLSTNLLGYFYTSAGLLKLLGSSKNHPQIINISSNASFARRAMVGVLYSISKAAITHLTKILATHLSSTNVRVNAIAPGLFPSELTTGGSDDKNKSTLNDTMGMKIPSGRPGTDKELACTVLYLAKSHVSQGKPKGAGKLRNHPLISTADREILADLHTRPTARNLTDIPRRDTIKNLIEKRLPKSQLLVVPLLPSVA